MTAIGDLVSWLHLRGPRPDPAAAEPVVPPGDGPLILLCGAAPRVPGLVHALRRGRRGVRLGVLGPAWEEAGERPIPAVLPCPPEDPVQARRLVAQLAPAALVLAEGPLPGVADPAKAQPPGPLPGALILACEEAGVSITLIATRVPAEPTAHPVWRPARTRNLLSRITRVLVADRALRDRALRLGLAPARVEVTGAPAVLMPPLRCNTHEHAALRPVTRDRHLWLAASLPLAEAPLVMSAQAHLLASHHRALLVVAPARAAEAEAIGRAAEEAGLNVALRELDEELTRDVQVLVAGDSGELGLWYRLAPVTFMGGTLAAGHEDCVRHPFEPAGLGSAILHGPRLGHHLVEWRALDTAGGSRLVDGEIALRFAVGDLTAPDQAARLAQAAWTVASQGAEVARRLAEAILSDLPDVAA